MEGRLIYEYRSFTQLTADKQFAHMGLMLLGVLAQVDNAVSVFASGPVIAGVGDGDNEVAEKILTLEGAGNRGTAHDVGVVVSREEFMLAERRIPVARLEGMLNTSLPSPHPWYSRDQPQETVETACPKDADQLKSKKKKKKATGGEFDDIFDSLENTSKRPKKKRKKGDEFDDIFNGL